MAWRRPMMFALAAIYAFGALRFIWAFRLLEFDFADALFVLATLGLLLLVVVETIVRIGPRLAAYRPQFRLVVVTVLLLLVVAEVWLRFGWGLYANYEELNLGHYRTRYLRIDQMRGSNDVRQHRYFVFPSHLNQSIQYPEFTYVRKTNSLGLRGQEIDARPAEGTFRIISLGDSFTEGFGVSETDTWPLQVGRMLESSKPGQRVESINAGIAGSDPVFEYTLLEEVLAPMRPDLVLLGFSGNDVVDLCTRGGFERYQPDGTVVLQRGPSYEWLYGVSYVVRHVLHDLAGYDGMIQSPATREKCQASARQVMRTVVDRSCRLAEKGGFSLAVVVYPMKHEMETGQYDLKNLWEGAAPRCANVLRLAEWFAEHGITPDNIDEFYYPIDRHHTARGLRLFAEGVTEHVIASGLFPASRSGS